MEPEQALWQQVAFRALCDALGFTNYSNTSDEHVKLVEEARRWFYEGGEDLEEVCELAGLSRDNVKASAITLIEARQSGDHSNIPDFWRDAFRRNRMPSFTKYAEEIEKALTRNK